jgi:hypothetical protein
VLVFQFEETNEATCLESTMYASKCSADSGYLAMTLEILKEAVLTLLERYIDLAFAVLRLNLVEGCP